MKHDGRVCECGKPVRISFSTGRNKGYHRTCGSEGCLARGRRSERAKEARKASLKPRDCHHCGVNYLPTSMRQRWCLICCPDVAARGRMQRYGISEVDYQRMLLSQENLCAICREKFPRCVDHNHTTRVTRKLLCDKCNTRLGAVEDKIWLERAMAYLTLYE